MSATHNWRWAIKADEEAAPKGKVTTESREAEQISGSLFRGKGGKFQGGPGTILINRMEAIRAKRRAKKKPVAPPAPPQGADAIGAFLGGLGLDPKLSDALSEYLSGLAADPPEEMALNKDAALALQAQGLIKIRPGQEDAGSLSIDLTSAGSRLSKAVAKGDIAAGMKVIEKGNERAATRAEKDKAKTDKAAAAASEKDKAAAAAETKPAEKPKGGGGGGGGSAKPEEKENEETAKPTAEEKATAKREAKIAKAAETAASVGLKPVEVDALRTAAEGGAVAEADSDGLVELGLVAYNATSGQYEATDAGRYALNSLERGDTRGYQNAVQNAKGKLDREKARGDKVRERAEKQKARDEEKTKREADRTAKQEQRTQERAAKQQARDDAKKKRDEDRAKAKTDKADAKDADAKKQLQKLAGDFRKGRRGLSLDQQDQLVEAGLGSVDDKGRFALKALSWRWAT